ncbi:hypothetical protein QFC20_003681 [Naganishia adeliensis]|uniref:Uncharacterized protein n=1 Tax=Naganishia adeliensis TaxID=92952 RepID=A0ACC2W8A0_9TREE|nr:hypothetical protein QFC20_003681 [Naganishia adeliensis]
MPRGKSSRGKRGGATSRLGRDAPMKQTGNRDLDNWKDIKYTNAAFEEYYQSQELMQPEEWPEFIKALKRDLPTTFRVTGSRAHAEALNDEIKEHYLPMLSNVTMSREALLNPNMQRAQELKDAAAAATSAESTPAPTDTDETGITVDSSTGLIKLAPPRQLEWYPGHLAWQLDVPKRVVRKSEAFKVFQRFLVGETEIGNISRQEAVSMIPPLLLDIESHHVCLDMCAAPGSKTAQMMEALNHHSTVTTGLLIANDADLKRCHMLVHQTGRMPSVGLGVTNNDASKIPTFKISTADGKTTHLAYDRILADVPCTGDGTLRKNLDIWKSWTPGNGSSLHPLQLRILLRAMQLLKPGGRMVYSTCSFNPTENEAVVAAALNSEIAAGEFKIVPQPETDVLPGLKRRRGLTQWKIYSQDDQGALVYHPSQTHHFGYIAGVREKRKQLGIEDEGFFQDDLEEAMRACLTRTEGDEAQRAVFEQGRAMGLEGSGKITGRDKVLAESLWAPENVQSLGLEHGLRLLPHDQDTGGFYVCVIERAPASDAAPEVVPAQKRAVSPSAPEGPEQGAAKKVKVDDGSAAVEDVAFVEAEKPVIQEENKGRPKKTKGTEHIFKEDPFFYVKADDPELVSCIEYFGLSADFPRERCFVRNGTGEANRNLYLSNEIVKNLIHSNSYHAIRLLSAGIRVFVRQDTQNRNTDLKCKWRIPLEGLASVLPYMDQSKILQGTINDLEVLLADMYPLISKQESGLLAEMKDKSLGCHVIVFNVGTSTRHGGGTLRIPITLPIWRAKDSLSLLIDKKEKSMLSLRTFGQDITSKTADIQRLAGEQTSESTPKPDETEDVVTGVAPAVGVAEEAGIIAAEELGDKTLEEAMNA